MIQPKKSPKIMEYFAVKQRMTVHSFIDLIKDIPEIDFETPHEGQWEILNAYEEKVAPSEESKALGLPFDYKYEILIPACGRRFGKSTISSVIGASELLIPNAKVLIVSYTLQNCEVIFKQIYKILVGLGIEIVENRQRDMALTLINGSVLNVASAENVEARLGTAISLLIIDEAKLFKKELYFQVLRPMLADMTPYSRTILISSPAEGWYEEVYDRGQSDDPRFSKYWSINLPSHANPTLPRSALEEMRLTMPIDLYNQEVLGMFNSAQGKVFREFDKVENVYEPEDFPQFYYWLEHNIIFQSIDSGYNHYFAAVWIMYVEEIDTYFVFGAYTQNKTLTPVHAQNIKDFEHELGIDVSIRYADPAASQQIADFAHYDLYFNKSDKELRETINWVNTLFFQRSEITGKPKLLIQKDLHELLRQVNGVQWKEDKDSLTREQAAKGQKPFKPDGEKKTDWDLIDALRYGVYSYIKNGQADCSVMTFENLDASQDEEEQSFERMMIKAGYFKA